MFTEPSSLVTFKDRLKFNHPARNPVLQTLGGVKGPRWLSLHKHGGSTFLFAGLIGKGHHVKGLNVAGGVLAVVLPPKTVAASEADM